MSLTKDIDQDLIAAIKGGEELAREVLRMLKSALANARIAEKVPQLSPEQEITVLSRELKSRKEAALEYEKVGAADRAKKELTEAAIVEKYLPAQMSEEDLKKAVAAALEESGASEVSQIGAVMGVLAKKLKGKADMKRVNQLVLEQLGARG